MICGMCKHICASFVSALYTRIAYLSDVEIESVSVLNLEEVEGGNKYECVEPSPSEHVDVAYWSHSYVLNVKSVIAIILEEEAWKLESV